MTGWLAKLGLCLRVASRTLHHYAVWNLEYEWLRSSYPSLRAVTLLAAHHLDRRQVLLEPLMVWWHAAAVVVFTFRIECLFIAC